MKELERRTSLVRDELLAMVNYAQSCKEQDLADCFGHCIDCIDQTSANTFPEDYSFGHYKPVQEMGGSYLEYTLNNYSIKVSGVAHVNDDDYNMPKSNFIMFFYSSVYDFDETLLTGHIFASSQEVFINRMIGVDTMFIQVAQQE